MIDSPAKPHDNATLSTVFGARELVTGGLAFVAAFAVYLYALAPTVTLGDSGELITAAVTLGVAHPPGYPLWLILAKLFSFLPIGSVAYRINLMSALFDALAIGLLAMIIAKTIPKVCARFIPEHKEQEEPAAIIIGATSAAAALILAFSPTFWRQSVIGEVYALNNLLICLIMLLLVLWGERPEKGSILFMVAFLFGIGQANHQTLLLLGPAIVVYVLIVRPKVALSPKLALGCLALFLLGLSLYFYLPIRATANPPINWGDPSSWERFWFHFTRGQYRTITIVRPLSVFVPQLRFFFSSILNESLPVVLLLPVVGSLWLSRREGLAWLAFTFAVFIFAGVFLIFIANTELDLNAQDILKVYFLPSFMVVAVWIGYGMGAIGLLALRIAGQRRAVAMQVATLTFLFLLLSAWNLAVNYDKAGMRHHDFGTKYGTLLMHDLPEGAVLLAGTDSAYAVSMYMKWVEGTRPDISILSVNRLSSASYVPEAKRNAPELILPSPEDYEEAARLAIERTGQGGGGIHGAENVALANGYLIWRLLQLNEAPIYYDEGLPIEWIRDYAVPSGLLFKMSREKVETLSSDIVFYDMNYWKSAEAKLIVDWTFINDIDARQKFSKCRSNIGSLYLHRKMYSEAEYALKQAIHLSDRNIEAYAALALLYREQGMRKESLDIFNEYMERDPWNTSGREFARWLSEAE